MPPLLAIIFGIFLRLQASQLLAGTQAVMAPPNKKAIFRQYAAGLTSHLGVAAAGAAFAFFEPLTLKLTQPDTDGVPMTSEQMSWVVAIMEIGCALSSVPVGYLADWYGRKYVCLSMGPTLLLGWLLVILTRSVAVINVMRVLHGIAISVAFTVNPIYTAEIVDPAVRGAIAGMFHVFFYAGCLYSFSLGPYVAYEWYAYSALVLPIIYTIAFSFFPESPYWLLNKGRHEEAKQTLRWFRNEDDVDKLYDSMKRAVAEEMGTENSWKALFFDKYERKAFILLQIVSTTKYWTGMPTILNYATETFSKSDGFLSASQLTILLGIMLTIIAVFPALLSDRLGRKFLLLVSCAGCFIAHGFTTLYYYLQEKTDVDAGPYIWMLYLGLTMYCLFSDIGLGPLLQTLQAELFGANTREIAGGITESLGSVLCFIVIKLYQPVSDEYGVYVNFLFYAVVAAVGGILIAILMYETKGKTIGRMEPRSAKT